MYVNIYSESMVKLITFTSLKYINHLVTSTIHIFQVTTNLVITYNR